MRVYIGTYTTGDSRGIYVGELDPGTGRWLSEPTLAAPAENPSFLAWHPRAPLLYAVNEVRSFEGAPTGAVSAFAMDEASGRLTLLSQQASGGTDPCHLIVDGAGRHVLVANYTCGNVTVLPIAADGRLRAVSSTHQCEGCGPVAARQEGPHAHAVLLDRSGRLVLFTDLGADRVYIAPFDSGTGELRAADAVALEAAPGAGPRHLAWHPSGTVLYLLNELDATISTLRLERDPLRLDVLQTVPARAAGRTNENTASEIVVAPDGRYVYASNRGDDSIAVLAVGPDTRTLSPVAHISTEGRTPRSFAIDPTGRWLVAANQGSGTLVVFRLDPVSGRAVAGGRPAAVPDPACVLFAPAG